MYAHIRVWTEVPEDGQGEEELGSLHDFLNKNEKSS